MAEDEQGRWRLKREVSIGDVIALAGALMAIIIAFMALRITDVELSSRINAVEITARATTSVTADAVSEIKIELRRLADKIDTLAARR